MSAGTAGINIITTDEGVVRTNLPTGGQQVHWQQFVPVTSEIE